MQQVFKGMSNGSSFAQLVMRVFCALVLTTMVGYSGIFYGEISAWLLANLILIVTYERTFMKQRPVSP